MSASLQPPIQWSADAIVIANEVATPPWKFLGRETRPNGKVRFTFQRENPPYRIIASLVPDYPLENLKEYLQACITSAQESPAS